MNLKERQNEWLNKITPESLCRIAGEGSKPGTEVECWGPISCQRDGSGGLSRRETVGDQHRDVVSCAERGNSGGQRFLGHEP